jgi:amidase
MKSFRRLVFAGVPALMLTGATMADVPASLPEELTIRQTHDLFAAGKLDSRQLVERYLKRIETFDRSGPRVNSFVTVTAEAARQRAAELDDRAKKAGLVGPLHGIPVALKDNIDVANVPTSNGWKGYQIPGKELIPPQHSTVVELLERAGAIVIGKTAMPDFAMNGTTVSSASGITRNPYGLTRSAGGSSGGSGAALGADFTALALGTDTGGSVRIPASVNAIVALKPTNGRVSLFGVHPANVMLDVVGPMAHSVEDVATVFSVIARRDPRDLMTSMAPASACIDAGPRLRGAQLKGRRIGVLWAYTAKDLNPATRALFEAGLAHLKRAGAELIALHPDAIDVSALDENVDYQLEALRYGINQYLKNKATRTPFASIEEYEQVTGLPYMMAYPQSPALVQPATIAKQIDSPYASSPSWFTSVAHYGAVRSEFQRVFQKHRLSAMVYPTLTHPPGAVDDFRAPYPAFANMSGRPALTVPSGYYADGIPFGVEFLGEEWGECELLEIGAAYEHVAQARRPPALFREK